MMSSAGGQKRSLREAANRVYQLGGVRAFYRGLTVCTSGGVTQCMDADFQKNPLLQIGLIGVFP